MRLDTCRNLLMRKRRCSGDIVPKKIVKKSTKSDKKISKKQKEQLRTIESKKRLLKEMIKSFGNVTDACKETGVCRETYYEYIKKDKKFKQMVEDIAEMRLDHVESKLNTLIDDYDSKAIIFFLKTKGKSRNYIERTEIDATRDNRVIIKIVKPEKKAKKK